MTTLTKPCGVFVSNDEVFIADTYNHRVRKVLRNGQIVTIAGTGIEGYNGDGQLATDAHLSCPISVVVSSSDQVYISEMYGNRIRKIDRDGIISTIAGNGVQGYNGDDQLAIHAQLNAPDLLFVNDDEEVLFADKFNHRVRKIDRYGTITTLAGNGTQGFTGDGQLAKMASLCSPTSVFQYKNEIYIADSGNRRIRKIDQDGIISTIAGNVTIRIYPDSIFVHNGDVYFTNYTSQLCKVLPNGTIKTIAGIENERGFDGDDMLATQCKLNFPKGIFIDDDSQIYIADTMNHCVRKIDQNGMMRSVVGTGKKGYSGDVPFDFQQYPHMGPRRKIKSFSHAYNDLIVKCLDSDKVCRYESATKKIKY